MQESSPLKLAFCITELNIGGAERAMTELACRIDKSRFTVMVYSLQPRPENDAASCVPLLEQAGIPVRFLNMKGASSFFSGLCKLRRELREEKPDILLSFLFHANFLGRLAAYRAGVPHVVSGIRVAEREARWHLTLDRWTSRLVEQYVCVSRSVAEFSLNVAKLPAKKLRVIPNGIAIETPELRPEKKNRILFVGRLDRQKGLDWLFRTLPDWLPKIPDWRLTIVGDGPIRDSLSELCQSEAFDSIRQRIEFLGRRNDVAKLLAASKMLVLPSRWEGMPNVILEAMTAALPVVATDAEGVLEILGPLASEQTCPFGDDKQFAERVLHLAQTPDSAEELGRRNRQRVAEHFSINAVVRQYEELFTELVGH